MKLPLQVMKSAYVVRRETADGPEVAMKIEDFIDGMTEHVAVILIVYSPDDELMTLLKVEASKFWEEIPAGMQPPTAGYHLLRVEQPTTQLRIDGQAVRPKGRR